MINIRLNYNFKIYKIVYMKIIKLCDIQLFILIRLIKDLFYTKANADFNFFINIFALMLILHINISIN
jgi:hypothetical protein